MRRRSASRLAASSRHVHGSNLQAPRCKTAALTSAGLVAAALALLVATPSAAAEPPHGPGAPPSREQLRALPAEVDREPEPKRWSGFDQLPGPVQQNLLKSGGPLIAAANGPNVRANNPAGD